MIADNIRSRFSIPSPLLLSNRDDVIKFEIKPYLQPFERELAMRELKALLGHDCKLFSENNYWLTDTDASVDFLLNRLTYWQRLGKQSLELTLQKALEFTQNSSDSSKKSDLHKARRLRYGPHDLHEYRGKFFPQLVRSLINISGIPENSVVLDPMSGSGTTPCEAAVLGMQAIGADLNPLSSLIADVKAKVPSLNAEDFLSNTLKRINNIIFDPIDPTSMWDSNDLSYLRRWFAEEALCDLASILKVVENTGKGIYRDFFNICLSNIIRAVSWQKESDLRVRKEITLYESGTAIKYFLKEVKEQCDRIYPYLCVLNNKRISNVSIRKGNAVEIASIFPEFKGQVDLLITSPPYATALPYLDTDRLSLIVLGLLPRKNHGEAERKMVGTREISERERKEAWRNYENRRTELPLEISTLIDKIAQINHADGIGFRRRNLPALLGKYFLSMLDAMRSAHSLMKNGAPAFYVVGNNSTEVGGEKIIIPTDDFLYLIGEKAGWTPVEKIPMELLSSRDIFKENRGSSETILCFKA
jgi:site-specific DNA-methyltransferase (cytosine-N4-specific)